MSELSRRILITGAASGIGAAAALRLAGPGAGLLLAARGASAEDRQRLEAIADRCRAVGAMAHVAFGDLGDAGVGESLVERTVGIHGGLDVLVSNAGFAERGGVAAARASLSRSFDVVAAAFAELASAARPHLAASPAGAVVAVSSFVAHRFRGEALFAPSAAAKAALEALVRTAAAELAPHGVTVNAVAPGYTRKDAERHTALKPEAWAEAARRVPMGRIAEAGDIAGAIAFLAGPDARYITGQVIHVDGGLGL
jgi:3-oxoacyl-[acyl-carrier protein] reductase